MGEAIGGEPLVGKNREGASKDERRDDGNIRCEKMLHEYASIFP